jgi:thiamine kinase-like enzyme
MNISAIPKRIEEISAQWLENVLKGSLFTGSIESLTYEPVEGGYTGLNYRVFLSTRDQGPLTIFVKFPVGNSYNTMSASNMDHFQTIARDEIRFYREIAPEIQLPTPRCLFSAYDDDNSLLILEDLGNGRLSSNRAELKEDQLAQIADSMASFHRHFWQDPRLESMDWIRTRFSSPRNRDEEIRSFQNSSRVFVNRFSSHLSTEQLRVINEIASEYPRLKTAVASPPLTLTHGDWTPANLVWKESETRAYVVDWAGICRGSYLWDVIKFLDFELNDRILGVFLNAYSKSLNRGRTLVKFDDLCSEFYLAQAWYLCGTIQFIAGIKKEHLHDPGTEWIWEFVDNQQIFSHLSTKII